ncbi:hypothetical protein PoB_007400800 [Plakobranchus ocellatus]|uniref:Uncharacterized protein n=1 Tax=Plakobranchus ocellatus TaxID=259542 RepID=A0AAV4DT44_9GAST|nr:hypothetical protein PoB_007400800 [Plakobranchus ocellatus]
MKQIYKRLNEETRGSLKKKKIEIGKKGWMEDGVFQGWRRKSKRYIRKIREEIDEKKARKHRLGRAVRRKRIGELQEKHTPAQCLTTPHAKKHS